MGLALVEMTAQGILAPLELFGLSSHNTGVKHQPTLFFMVNGLHYCTVKTHGFIYLKDR